MIFEYGFSVVGKSHLKKGTCCQDFHCIKRMENGWVIAAVADGVGSAKNSHISSKIAAQTAVEFCEEYMPWDYNLISIKSMMRTAYNFAYKLILREAKESGEPVESYDTTLTMVIYDGQRIIYGHSGDGAIIGLTTFGDYVEITRPQKGADGVSVLPLRSGYTQWVIDSYEEDLAAVILATDGMLETICPYLLRDQERKIDRAYVALASFFADPNSISEDNASSVKEIIGRFITAEEDYCADEFYERLSAVLKSHLSEGVDEIIERYKQNNYPIALMQKEQDDKTVVGLINLDLPLDSKDASFYSEPDWNALQEAWNRKAYPHLYKDKGEEKKDISVERENDDSFEKVELTEVITEKADDTKKPNEAKSSKAPGADDEIEIIISKTNSQSSMGSTSAPAGDTTKKGGQRTPQTNRANKSDTDPVKPKNAASATPPKHDKLRKKGVLGFFEDLFN